MRPSGLFASGGWPAGMKTGARVPGILR